jgi:S-adenosylmethionine decarboxylase
MSWKNLAPGLVRQRVIIEGTSDHVITPEEISSYLKELSSVLGMRPLREPFSYQAEDMGYGGWIHWVTSGAHFYSYTTTPPFFSVDAYTCKSFDVEKAAEFTRTYFLAMELVWKEVAV